MDEPQSDQGEPPVRQFVYRQTPDVPIRDLRDCEGVVFHLAAGPLSVPKLLRPLLSRFGFAELVKITLKLATRKRQLYLFIGDGKVAHFGWLNIGFCGYYKVEEGDVTIGPIWSDKSMRGRGLATEGLKRAVNAMFERGHRVFYIDTSEDNIPAQRAIAKAGFGDPVDYYEETPGGWVHLEGAGGGKG